MRAISVLGKTNLGHEELICLAVPWDDSDGRVGEGFGDGVIPE